MWGRMGLQGHVGWGRRNAGTSNIGDAGGKVGSKCDISFFVKMCYLWSTLDSIVQNHIVHLMMFTQNIALYRSISALTILIRVKHC